MMDTDDSFLLSRIEAQGWNAAQRVMIGEKRIPDEVAIARLNPHKADPARARWRTGFKNAVDRAGAK